MTDALGKMHDYAQIMEDRLRLHSKLVDDKMMLAAFCTHYSSDAGVADFIDDWGMTFDPRKGRGGVPATMPFKLFQRQREWVDWLVERISRDEDGITEKSRDMGVTWLAVAVICTLCLFRRDQVFGFGSRKEVLVDKIGDPDCILWKARKFLELLPSIFTAGWDAQKHSAHMRIDFPHTGCVIRGEAGDNIGRGGRARAYITDEDAFIPRIASVDAALSANTNCRIRVSTVNGRQNSFARLRHSGAVPVFTFHWTSDPRKNQEWYEAQKLRLDPMIVAQEIDINYDASIKGQLIPMIWILACVDAHLTLGIDVSGERVGALDVADEGPDKNAFAARHGVLLHHAEEWSGAGIDTYATAQRAFGIANHLGLAGFVFDSDGLGAGIRGDSRMINEDIVSRGMTALDVTPWRGSGAVVDPDGPVIMVDGDDKDRLREDRINKDFFANAKAQAWWHLRTRIQRTYRAVEAKKAGEDYAIDHDSIISIDGAMNGKNELLVELAQPTYKTNEAGKILINKAPDNSRSPNRADAVMMLFAPRARAASVMDLYR